jgi:hypothetical protein
MVLPTAIMQFVLGMHQAGLAQILDQIQHPGKAPVPATSGAVTALFFALIAVSVALYSFMLVAIAAAIGDLYRGARPEWTSCYAHAARRFGAIVVTLLGEVAALVGLFTAGAIAIFMVFFLAFLLVRLSAVLGVVGIVAAALVVLGWILSLMLCYLAFGLAFNALGNEAAGSANALLRGFSLVFNRREFGRALLICLALAAINIGLSAVSLGVAAGFELLHFQLLNVVVNAIISLVSSAFIGVLLAVYYFDVRVRREGLDLQTQIEQLQSAASAP